MFKVTHPQKPYHHGHLKDELLRVAVDIGREEGPEGITIRQVTRRVGVSPTAAYRHYTDQTELLNAVSAAAVTELVTRLNAVVDDHETYPLAAERMVACGWAYFDFALEEPGFFRCMLAGRDLELPRALGGAGDDESMASHTQALTKFADCFHVHADQTDHESHFMYFFQNVLSVWATVHGITVLCTTGHMAELSIEKKRELAAPVLAAAVRSTDFKDPLNLFRNYPGGVRPAADS